MHMYSCTQTESPQCFLHTTYLGFCIYGAVCAKSMHNKHYSVGRLKLNYHSTHASSTLYGILYILIA